jgi:hypothetical protein
MGIGNVPNLPNIAQVGGQAIVRQVEKDNSTPRDAGQREREAEAKRQQSQRQNPNTSGK